MEERSTVWAQHCVRLLGYLLCKEGYTLSGSSRRKMGNLAKQVEPPLTNVEKVLGLAVDWAFCKVFPGRRPEGFDESSIVAVDGSVAEHLIQHYLENGDIIPLTKNLHRSLGEASQVTDVPVGDLVAIVKPIYERLVEKAFRNLPESERPGLEISSLED